MNWLKSAGLFLIMLLLFAAGLIVVSQSEGGASWVAVALVTLGFGVWYLWKRNRRSATTNRPGKHGVL